MKVVVAVALAAFVLPTSPARATTPPPELPAPAYKSVSKEVLIPMDDGVRLAATVAFPSRDGQTPLDRQFPMVLQMTPAATACAAASRPTSSPPGA